MLCFQSIKQFNYRIRKLEARPISSQVWSLQVPNADTLAPTNQTSFEVLVDEDLAAP